MIEVRRGGEADVDVLIVLFRETVHAINAHHYAPEQIAVWAPAEIDRTSWLKRFELNHVFVAECDGKVCGFSELTESGVVHMLYVHRDWQRRGVASALMSSLEALAESLGLGELTTEASITAKPFFERRGFSVVTKQKKLLRDMVFLNYRMRKALR